MSLKHKVIFPQFIEGKDGAEIEVDVTLLDYTHKLGIQIPDTCGGRGECGKCLVKIENGMDGLEKKTDVEDRFNLGNDERLACQAKIISGAQDILVLMRATGKYRILTECIDGSFPFDPLVLRRGDEVVHGNDYNQALGKYEGAILGLTIDVGTTTLVAQLLDLERGETLAISACKNPQVVFGEDVISRIGYTNQDQNGLTHLQRIVVQAVNTMVRDFEKDLGRNLKKYVYETVVVGNPTMRNLFFGKSVHSLGMSPFEPEDTSPINEKAEDLGLHVNSKGKVYGAPLIAGQVGADCLGVILTCDLSNSKKPCMAVDIGTNGEVVIGNKERIVAASNAAGGAFEGATVSCGVGAIEGAIKNIWIKNGKITFETIGDKPPIGICGSGFIDLLAEMQREGIINEKCRLSESYRNTNEFLINGDGIRIGITQKDINELRLAKAGLVLNQKTVMRKYGVDLDGLDSIFLVGGFGNYVNIDNAIAIGVLPNRKERFVKIGNGALAGARQMLLSRKKREDGERLAKQIEHVKLFEEENLLERYVNELSLKKWV